MKSHEIKRRDLYSVREKKDGCNVINTVVAATDLGVAEGEVAPECAFGYLVEPLSWMDVNAYEGKVSD